MNNFKIVFLGLIILCIFIGCGSDPETDVVSKYTNEIALAIIDSGWKIAWSIEFAAFIRGFLNK